MGDWFSFDHIDTLQKILDINLAITFFIIANIDNNIRQPFDYYLFPIGLVSPWFFFTKLIEINSFGTTLGLAKYMPVAQDNRTVLLKLLQQPIAFMLNYNLQMSVFFNWCFLWLWFCFATHQTTEERQKATYFQSWTAEIHYNFLISNRFIST